MGTCMCYGVNTSLVLITPLSRSLISPGSGLCICFLSAFVPAFNINRPEYSRI